MTLYITSADGFAVCIVAVRQKMLVLEDQLFRDELKTGMLSDSCRRLFLQRCTKEACALTICWVGVPPVLKKLTVWFSPGCDLRRLQPVDPDIMMYSSTHLLDLDSIVFVVINTCEFN